MPLIPARLEFAADGTRPGRRSSATCITAPPGGRAARHVFLAGNRLPERWAGRERFVILETGFGIGLNFLATWQAWRRDPARCGRLHFRLAGKAPFHAFQPQGFTLRYSEFEGTRQRNFTPAGRCWCRARIA